MTGLGSVRIWRCKSPHPLVAAGAERFLARAGEDDDTDIRILACVCERLTQLLNRERPEGVAHFRPVDRDLRDALDGLLVDHVLELADWLPFHGHLGGPLER